MHCVAPGAKTVPCISVDLVAMIPIPLGGPLGVAAAPGHMALPEAIAGVPANATAAVAISKMRIFQISFVVVLASPP